MTDEVSDSKDDDSLQNLTFECVALHDFKAEQKYDLSFQQGELLTVTGVRDNGWWEAKNDKGETGLIPSTFFKIPDHIKAIIDAGKRNISSSDTKGSSRKDTRQNAETAKTALDFSMKDGKQLRVRFATHGAALKVKNLSPWVSNELLEAAFSVFGEVERAVVIVDDCGKPVGEGIVEYARKQCAQMAIERCSEGCYLLTSSPRPVVVEPLEQRDEGQDGLPEKNFQKGNKDYLKEREIGPRLTEPGTFEHEFANRWKKLFELEQQKRDHLEKEIEDVRRQLDEQMDFAIYEHEANLLRERLRLMEEQSSIIQRERETRREEEIRREESRRAEEMLLRQQQEEILRNNLRRRQEENMLMGLERPERNEDFVTDETDPPRTLVDRFSEMSMNQDVLPKGFRTSVLFDLAQKDSLYSMSNFMAPKLDESGISFKDICYEKALLKPNATLLQKKISLIAARQIPEPPSDFTVKSCHIRMCLHDGNKVLSNIHRVKAKWNKSAPKLWVFNSKITSKDSCVEEGEIFIKCNECVPTLGILFELCISYEHLKGTSGEMCSGWAFMKLLNDSGEPVKSKTNILKVEDTEPFTAYFLPANSQGIASFFKKIKDKQKHPRLVISICDPDRPSNQQIGYLPSCLIGPYSCIPILCLSRKVTAEDLLERSSFDSTERILSPVLASLPHVLNDPYLLDALRVSWTSNMKNFNTDDKKMDNTKAFRDLFCETVFNIVNSNNLPPLKLGNSESENAREAEIKRILHIQDAQEETLSLSEELEFPPLSLDMISANIINLNKGVKL